MVKGVGVDIVDIERIRVAINRFSKFETKLFSEPERDYCRSKKRPHLHYAVRFAAKEAVVKSLGTGVRGFSWRDISVDRDELGKPAVTLHNGAADVANNKNIQNIELSLSFSKNQAVAVAVAIGENSRK